MKKAAVLLLVLILVGSFFIFFPESSLSSEAVENSWSTKKPLPQTGGSRVAVVDGKIHAISGSVHYVYDPATDDWTSRKPMPTPRHYFGIAVCDNKIYTVGGGYWDDGWVTSNVNEVYDPQTDSWETKTSMPTSRMSLYANEVEGKIYMIGGQTGGPNSIVNLNDAYDVATDSWAIMEPSPYAVDSYGSAVVDGKIYILGGSASHSARVSLNQIYDPATDTWGLGAEMPESVRNTAAGATSGLLAPKRIYVIGGGPDMLATNFTQVYDPENDSWTLGAEMPTARGWLAVAVVNDLIYAIGGSPYLMASSLTTNEQYVPYGYATTDYNNDGATLAITVISPVNKTYATSSIPLEFSSSESLSWMGYRLDNGGIIEVAGNTTISGLSLGSHNLTVYTKNSIGNTAASEMIYFTIQEAEVATYLVLVAAVCVTVIIAGAGLLVYFKKWKH